MCGVRLGHYWYNNVTRKTGAFWYNNVTVVPGHYWYNNVTLRLAIIGTIMCYVRLGYSSVMYNVRLGHYRYNKVRCKTGALLVQQCAVHDWGIIGTIMCSVRLGHYWYNNVRCKTWNY